MVSNVYLHFFDEGSILGRCGTVLYEVVRGGTELYGVVRGGTELYGVVRDCTML